MRKRKLSKEEQELWRKVAESTDKLQPMRISAPVQDTPLPIPDPVVIEPRPIPKFTVGENSKAKPVTHSLMPSLSDQIGQQPVQMDKKAFTRLKRGKMLPEGKLDLHGMTLEQAHPALIGFILRSVGEGKRLVLVITGKGKSKQDEGPIPVRMGVLKHQVPQWLRMAPVKAVVMQVTEAHLKHGGSGAYYVYLRRNR